MHTWSPRRLWTILTKWKVQTGPQSSILLTPITVPIVTVTTSELQCVFFSSAQIAKSSACLPCETLMVHDEDLQYSTSSSPPSAHKIDAPHSTLRNLWTQWCLCYTKAIGSSWEQSMIHTYLSIRLQYLSLNNLSHFHTTTHHVIAKIFPSPFPDRHT